MMAKPLRLGSCASGFAVTSSVLVLLLTMEAKAQIPENDAGTTQGRFLYTVGTLSNDISEYQTLRNPQTVLNRLPAGNLPRSVAVDPEGNFVYVANSDGVDLFRIEEGGRLLKPLGTTAIPGGVSSIAVESRGRFVYAVQEQSNRVVILRLDGEQGRLTRLGKVLTGESPVSVVSRRTPHRVVNQPLRWPC